MHETLWAGWRHRYLESGRSSDRSVFREILQSGRSDEECLIVHRGDHVFVIMNLHPYTVGHVLVLPYRQVTDLEGLTDEEFADLWQTVRCAGRVIGEEYGPEGLNIGMNLGAASGGSVRDHVHVHVVPRWIGDGNFLAATASTRHLPEALDVTAERLRRAWTRTLAGQ